MITIGIDPGKSGGIAVLRNGSHVVELIPMPHDTPTTRVGDYNLPALRDIFGRYGNPSRYETALSHATLARQRLDDPPEDVDYQEELRRLVRLVKCADDIIVSRATRVMLEKQAPMRGQGKSDGVKAAFYTGEGWGTLKTILFCCGLGYETVAAGSWQRKFGLTGLKLEGPDKKRAHIAEAKRQFPEVADQLTVSKDGLADALLIAKYAWLDAMVAS